MNTNQVTHTQFILYVKDQVRSTEFYSRVLDREPSLNVPGMTEFSLTESSTLGLMPISNIKQLLGVNLPDPARSNDIPRCELYLLVSEPLAHHKRAIEAGAVELSGLENRDWGHRAAYSRDPDGHVLAFAERIKPG
jgi:uncharacterized glyoxalase superfamily protein PhnB